MRGHSVLGLILVLSCAAFSEPISSRDYDEESAKEYLKKINEENAAKTTESVIATWGYESNITDETLQNQVGSCLVFNQSN